MRWKYAWCASCGRCPMAAMALVAWQASAGLVLLDEYWVPEITANDAGDWQLQAGWVRLGEVKLEAGEHRFGMVGLPGAGGVAIDCWLLTRSRFRPHGASKPPGP